MNKSILTVLLIALFTSPAIVHAGSSANCAMAKYMAGHALTVIKGGATLDQTLGMFEASGSNAMIINEIYSRKDSLELKKDAEMIGVNICMKGGDKV